MGFDHILATNLLSWLERVSLIECRRTSTRCGIGRMSAFAVLMMFLSAAQIAAALTCYCIDCSIGIECTGDQCYAQVVSGQCRWRCYNRAYIYLLHTMSVFHTTVCYDSADHCNANLYPVESTLITANTSNEHFKFNAFSSCKYSLHTHQHS